MHDQEEKWSARNVNDGRCMTKKKSGEQEIQKCQQCVPRRENTRYKYNIIIYYHLIIDKILSNSNEKKCVNK